MKTSFLYLRPFIAIASLVGVAACGGSSSFPLTGVVYGLSADATGLVLANGSDTVEIPVTSVSYNFPKPIDYGSSFNVVVKTQPRHMNCVPGSPAGVATVVSGTAGTNSTSGANFLCTRNPYTLGGTITGLTVDNQASLQMNNGASSTFTLGTIDPNGTTFTFTTAVADGATYGVTVQPSTTSVLNCTVVNGTGVMGEANVTNIQVNCVPK